MCLFKDPYPLNRGERIRLLLAESCAPVTVDGEIGTAERAVQHIDHGAADIALKVRSVAYREARRIIEVSQPYRIPCVKGVSSETDFGSLATLRSRAAIHTLGGFPAENSFYFKLNRVPIG